MPPVHVAILTALLFGAAMGFIGGVLHTMPPPDLNEVLLSCDMYDILQQSDGSITIVIPRAE